MGWGGGWGWQPCIIHYITLHDMTLQYITLIKTLHCVITLHYITLHYITLHYITLHYITLHYTTLHYTTLHYTTLHYTTLHYITLHYITLHMCEGRPRRPDEALQARLGWPLGIQPSYDEAVLAWMVRVRKAVLSHRYGDVT